MKKMLSASLLLVERVLWFEISWIWVGGGGGLGVMGNSGRRAVYRTANSSEVNKLSYTGLRDGTEFS